MTKPKSAGELGLRDIQLFNQVLLAKQAWRIIKRPESLLSRILLGKYCHKQVFLKVEAPKSCSHGWRSVLHGRDLLRDYLGKAIGNGQTTRVWQDSWISTTEQVKPYGPIPQEELDLTVADLLTDEMKWNEKKVKEILPHLADQILCIQPSQTGAEDTVIWQPSKSGIYNTKSGYSVAATKNDKAITPSEHTIDWNRDIWNAPCSPKMKVFLWSIMRRALPLGENLQQRGIQAEALCVRCKEKETAMHIFLNVATPRKYGKGYLC